MLIHEIAPKYETIQMLCSCGECFPTANLYDRAGKIQGSAWCITCNRVFLKSEGQQRFLSQKEVLPAMEICISELSVEQARVWLLSNDLEGSDLWRNISGEGLIKAVEENLTDFGYDHQEGFIRVRDHELPEDQDRDSLKSEGVAYAA